MISVTTASAVVRSDATPLASVRALLTTYKMNVELKNNCFMIKMSRKRFKSQKKLLKISSINGGVMSKSNVGRRVSLLGHSKSPQ